MLHFFIVFSQQANGGPTAHYTSAAKLLWSPYYCKKLPYKYTRRVKNVTFFYCV